MWEDALADQRCLRHEWGSGRVGESGRIVKMVCVCVGGGQISVYGNQFILLY